MHHPTDLVLVIVLMGAAGLWAVWRICCAVAARRRRRAWQVQERSGYVTVCEYGPDGTRWIMRRPVSQHGPDADTELPDFLRPDTDAELPAFLRKQPLDN